MKRITVNYLERADKQEFDIHRESLSMLYKRSQFRSAQSYFNKHLLMTVDLLDPSTLFIKRKFINNLLCKIHRFILNIAFSEKLKIDFMTPA